jgi:hypothetical protein
MVAQDLIVVADSYGFTSARIVATSAALLGLFGAIVGGLALSRSRRRGTGSGRRGAMVALPAGLIAAAVGVWSLAVADGGPGTGNGVVGAYLALVLGPLALAFGGMVLARARSVRVR